MTCVIASLADTDANRAVVGDSARGAWYEPYIGLLVDDPWMDHGHGVDDAQTRLQRLDPEAQPQSEF